MKRSVYPACVLPLPLLLLAACVSEPSAPPPPAAEPQIPAAAEPAVAPPRPLAGEELRLWLGSWLVTEVYASAQSGQPSRPPNDQRLELAEAFATDPDGRTCAKPSFRADGASEADFLGLNKSMTGSLRQIRPRLLVTCGTESFGSYLSVKDGSLLTRLGDKTLRLAHLPDGPVPGLSVTEPLAAAPPAVPSSQSVGDGGGAARPVYLASYRDQATALSGWKELARVSPLLEKARPEMTKVTLPGKGTFLRLQATGLSDADGVTLCKALRRLLPDCGARDRH